METNIKRNDCRLLRSGLSISKKSEDANYSGSMKYMDTHYIEYIDILLENIDILLENMDIH